MGFCQRHGECKKLGESTGSGLDDVLEEIAKTEQALIMCPRRFFLKDYDDAKGRSKG